MKSSMPIRCLSYCIWAEGIFLTLEKFNWVDNEQKDIERLNFITKFLVLFVFVGILKVKNMKRE